MMKKADPGLEGVIAAETALSSVDGERGELIIAGYRVEELAPRVSFEEAVYLLWKKKLPEPAELAAFREELGRRRKLPPAVLDLVAAASRAGTPPMDTLRTAISALALGPAPDELAIVAAFPTVIAAYVRLTAGQAPI